jgi:hypothetical protein
MSQKVPVLPTDKLQLFFLQNKVPSRTYHITGVEGLAQKQDGDNGRCSHEADKDPDCRPPAVPMSLGQPAW